MQNENFVQLWFSFYFYLFLMNSKFIYFLSFFFISKFIISNCYKELLIIYGFFREVKFHVKGNLN